MHTLFLLYNNHDDNATIGSGYFYECVSYNVEFFNKLHYFY